jgi:hypothetical protein
MVGRKTKSTTLPTKNSLVLSAKKLLASKSKREVERLVGQRKVNWKRRHGRLLRASQAWQRWEEKLLGTEHDLIVARKTGRTLEADIHVARRYPSRICLLVREKTLQSEAHLMQITDALGALRFRLGLRNRGEQKGGEDSYDGNDGQQLQEGESLVDAGRSFQ